MIVRPSLKSITVFILLTGILTLAGCSYFNAFFNTQRSFKEAEAERERTTDMNARPAGYNDAVEAGSRLIEMYPESKYIDDALFIMGQSYYWLKDYHKARRKFEELLSNYPDSPHVMAGIMWLGKVNVQLKKREEATSQLRGLIADTDDPKLVGESRFALAELYYVDSLFVKAAEEFAKIPDISDDKDLIGKSYWRAGESLYREKRFNESAEMLELALDSQLTPSLHFRSELLYGQALRESGNPEVALNLFNSLIKDKRYFREHGKVRVQKGLALAALDQRADAFAEWDRTILDHSRTDEAAQAYYEMGVVHLETTGERPEAKDMFDKARIEKPRSKYSMRADTLLTMLNRVDQLNLDRNIIRQRIDFTEEWIADPIQPEDSLAFTSLEFYDSLAFDSLGLSLLWQSAWRDSVIIIEPDSSAIQDVQLDSLGVDSLAFEELSESGADSSFMEDDSTAVMLRPSGIDPLAEFMPAPPDTVSMVDTLIAADSLGIAELERAVFDTVGIQPPSRGPEFNPGMGDPRRMRRMEMPDSSMRPEGMPQEEWDRLIAERFSTMERGGPPMPGEFPEMERGRGADMFPAPAMEKPLETSAMNPDLDIDSGQEVEILTIYDLQPVLDSLAQMRADLLEARFQLGEIQLFDLMQPDSARRIFVDLTGPENVDSVRARARSVLAFLERQGGDTTAADSILLTIAEEFPTTRAGRQIIEQLGLQEEEIATPAELAYREAEQLLISDSLYQEAYSQYRWVSETYSNTVWAPRAIYAAAYVAGKYLNDGETTEELLTQLIDDYEESAQAQRARERISAYDLIRFASEQDTVDIATQFAEFDALGEEEVDQIAEIIGGVEALSSTLDSRNLLPQEVIQGTGGEVLLRFIVNAESQAGNFKIVMEDPPGRGLGRALIAGLEEMPFRSARLDGEPVATRVERRYTLPLDAPPNVRPLPKR